jgi:proteic killer suppression protein
MIWSSACKETENSFHGRFSTKMPQDIQHIDQRKLKQLNGASSLDFLYIPPGNRLKKLSGDRAASFSTMRLWFKIDA